MLKTQAEIARLAGATRLVVSRFIAKHDIKPSGKEGKLRLYDCAAEPLAAYLGAKPNQPAPALADIHNKPSAKTTPHQKSDTAVRRVSKPLNDMVAGITKPGQKPAELFFAEALKLAKAYQDAGLYFKLGQIAAKEDADEALRLQALKTEQAKEQIAQERAERLRIENDIKRSFYMEKAMIKLIFGKQYAIDSNIFMPLGLKLADMIDALPASAGRRTKIQKLIDDEVYSALESKNRLLEEYIESDKC